MDFDNKQAVAARLDTLLAQAAAERAILDYPARSWVPPHLTAEGTPVLNVLVVGAGQAGLAILLALMRDHVGSVLAIDVADEGEEGPWLDIARMTTLRTPKEVTGPDLGISSLSFRRWYEACHGAEAWRELEQIPRTEWSRYLAWLRRALDLPVLNRTRLDGIAPHGDHLAASVVSDDGARTLFARKIVLATGVDGGGGWFTPAAIKALPRKLWVHSSEDIPFGDLRGKHVAVLGAGASAMDNAAEALENGAASVRQYCRRPTVAAIQPYKWMAFPGFMRHVGDMDDAWRWRFMSHILAMREPFTKDAWQRVSRFENYRMLIGATWSDIAMDGEGVRIRIGRRIEHADFVICGTGVEVDHRLRPELVGFADRIAVWGNRYIPPPAEADERLACFPYLAPTFAYTAKEPGTAPYLSNIHCFNFAATMSMGPSGAAIRSLKYAVPKLAYALTRDLFRSDLERHWHDLQAFEGREFEEFPGPASPIFEPCSGP